MRAKPILTFSTRKIRIEYKKTVKAPFFQGGLDSYIALMLLLCSSYFFPETISFISSNICSEKPACFFTILPSGVRTKNVGVP